MLHGLIHFLLYLLSMLLLYLFRSIVIPCNAPVVCPSVTATSVTPLFTCPVILYFILFTPDPLSVPAVIVNPTFPVYHSPTFVPLGFIVGFVGFVLSTVAVVYVLSPVVVSFPALSFTATLRLYVFPSVSPVYVCVFCAFAVPNIHVPACT